MINTTANNSVRKQRKMINNHENFVSPKKNQNFRASESGKA